MHTIEDQQPDTPNIDEILSDVFAYANLSGIPTSKKIELKAALDSFYYSQALEAVRGAVALHADEYLKIREALAIQFNQKGKDE